MIDVNQKYDVGDKVVIKPWWLMVKQYGFVTEDIVEYSGTNMAGE